MRRVGPFQYILPTGEIFLTRHESMKLMKQSTIVVDFNTMEVIKNRYGNTGFITGITGPDRKDVNPHHLKLHEEVVEIAERFTDPTAPWNF